MRCVQRCLEQLLSPFHSYPLTPLHQTGRITRKLVRKILSSTEILPIRILYPTRHYHFITDIIARTGKPIIVSTGMATLAEIDEAVRTITECGIPYNENRQQETGRRKKRRHVSSPLKSQASLLRSQFSYPLALLKCTSAYPVAPEEMNLRTIPHLAEAFAVPVGLSDHMLGACLIEKHLTLSLSLPGPDSAFSLEPHEFRAMVEAVRTVEKSLGTVHYGVSGREAESRVFRRSLFIVRDVRSGDPFTMQIFAPFALVMGCTLAT